MTGPSDPLPLSPETEAGRDLLETMEEIREDYYPFADYPDRECIIAIEQEARTLARTEWATWLLDIDYGVDFSTPGNRAPVDVLEEMVRIADADPKYQFGGEAYYVLSSELGDWRADNNEAAALSRLGERE